MTFCEILIKDTVIKKAFHLIRTARSEITATMQVDEELNSPLPQSYHLLLQRKQSKGVRITRYGYGTKKAFIQIQKKYPDIYILYAGGRERFQRMLLVDNRRGMFLLNDIFFYTQYVPLVKALRSYAVNSIIGDNKGAI